jgi:hypothetical protein
MLDDLLARVRTENLNVYRASQQRLREDVGQESQIAQDYRGRLIYELLQNADDAMSPGSSPEARISFILDDEALWVANSGRPLNESDIRGLCGISASSKFAKTGMRRASIGHKGMGFKSVLEISDAPEVYSTTICFCFGPEKALQAVHTLVDEGILAPVTRAPITRFPWPIEDKAVLWQKLSEQGMQTAFRFPLSPRMTEEQRNGLAQTLRDLPLTSLVFLKHLSRVEVTVQRRCDAYSFAWTAKRQKVTDIGVSDVPAFSDSGTYRVVLTPDVGHVETFLVAHDAEIAIEGHRGGLDEFTWEGVELTEVSVATRMRGSKPVELELEWKKLHVFLPTGEPCPYDLLVSGAFGSNLSRQEIRVESDASNYNRLLLRSAARSFRNRLIPRLLGNGASVVDVLKLLDRGTTIGARCNTAAAQALFDEVRIALLDLPFLPRENGDSIAIATCVVPPIVSDPEVGREFRALLPIDASSEAGSFPSTELCGSDVARVLVDHGAMELSPEDAAATLANPDPRRSQLDISGKLFVDPVLRVLEKLWQVLDVTGRDNLAKAVRSERLFPIGIAEDGTARRVATDNVTCFYPPRSLHGTVPLDGLCFLMQEICWGDLTPKERNQKLKQEVATWQALFDVQEFKFPAVMRASVLPALDLDRDAENRGARESLHTLERIAAICQLAGRTPNASAPLPYERLRTNRALFNLSRLDLPCRGATAGAIVWIPAYRAYLGNDWVADRSVERVFLVGHELDAKGLPAIDFLVGPEAFVGLLAKYRHLHEAPQIEDIDLGTDEISLDEDDEAALEGDERSRWLTFFQWLGVNMALRPVHFHDVEDRASGWLKTVNLQRPEGWIFKNVSANVWDEYVNLVRKFLAEDRIDNNETPYFYRLHDLEHLVTLLGAAAEDRSTRLGRALYEHLARNWISLERFSRAIIAQIPVGNVPSMRTKPQRARDEELIEAGPDFWIFRLQESPFCPTGHGPRHAKRTWLPTQEVERRFGRRAMSGFYLVPVLQADAAALKGKAKGFAQALGIREELSPATFTQDDARVVLERLRDLYAARFKAGEELKQELRDVIRPGYRHLFELLSVHDQPAGKAAGSLGPLANAPLLAHDGQNEYRFFEGRKLYYVDRRDTRERLQSQATIWSFVIESLPVARSPMVQIFGVRVLEDMLRWAPSPGEVAFDGQELERLKDHIRGLAPYLLARIAADRADEKLARLDAQRLRRFVECIEAVTHLDIGYELDGHTTNLGSVSRDAFVALEPGKQDQAFVVWGERPWPPEIQEAEALANALCDVFDSRYFEPFLALIQAKAPEDWERLLRRAGAPLDIEEKRALFLGDDYLEGDSSETVLNPSDEPKTTVATGKKEQAAILPNGGTQPSSPADIRRTPLYSLGQLLIDGKPILVTGTISPQTGGTSTATRTTSAVSGDTEGRNRGYGGRTDLDALNSVGMWIALSFERNRLRQSGLDYAEIFDPTGSLDQPEALIFDVSTPDKIVRAREMSTCFEASLQQLSQKFGVSPEWPGFDILTLDPRASGLQDRLIELKSSGVASRVQEMSWNEWKTAGSSALGARFYLYLVGNLRSDLEGAQPFVRTIRNPFEQLVADVRVGHTVSRKVQLAVHIFKEAEHLNLSVIESISSPLPKQESISSASLV